MNPLLPDWAFAENLTQELVMGAQLCTKDGRKIGNAHIVQIVLGCLGGKIYCILTDAGTPVPLSESEVHELFYVGRWISDPDEVVKRFGRVDSINAAHKQED